MSFNVIKFNFQIEQFLQKSAETKEKQTWLQKLKVKRYAKSSKHSHSQPHSLKEDRNY